MLREPAAPDCPPDRGLVRAEERAEAIALRRRVEAVLSPQELKAAWEWSVGGRLQKEIAAEPGVHRSRVGEMIHKAAAHAREVLPAPA
jgi:hypothetical protein